MDKGRDTKRVALLSGWFCYSLPVLLCEGTG